MRAPSTRPTPQGDGDTIFSLATGRWDGDADVTTIGALAADAMAQAVVRAATQAAGSRAFRRRAMTGISCCTRARTQKGSHWYKPAHGKASHEDTKTKSSHSTATTRHQDRFVTSVSSVNSVVAFTSKHVRLKPDTTDHLTS